MKIMAELSKMPKPKPTLRLTEDELPEIKDWKVGKVYKIELTVKQIEMRQGSEFESQDKESKKTHAVFEVQSAKSTGAVADQVEEDTEEKSKKKAVDFF